MTDQLTITVCRKSTQRQVNVTHADVMRLCDKAGKPRPTKDSPLRLGSPAKGRQHFVLECVTKDGEEYSLVMGDTHAIWDTPKHQGESLGAEKLSALVAKLPKGGRALLRVTAVRWIQEGEGEGEAPEAIEV